MRSRYHVHMTRTVLGEYFAPHALDEVISANVGQDSLSSVFGDQAWRHFCGPSIAHSLRYIETEHAQVTELAHNPGCEPEQRAAFGRLLHTAQDFYAHSNYVDLWLAARTARPASNGSDQAHATTPWNTAAAVAPLAGDHPPAPIRIDGCDRTVLHHPSLRIGNWVFWRDLIFYVPLVGDLARALWVPPGSHEAMHLDSPERGPRFYYALVGACHRTHLEFRRVESAVRAAGGERALARFLGHPAQSLPTTIPLCPIEVSA